MSYHRLNAARAALFACVFAAFAGQLVAQELAHGGDPVEKPQMGPPEQLAKAEFLIGEWDVAAKMKATIDAPWEESTATSVVALALGGSVIRSTFSGSMMGMEFDGEEILTFNRDSNRWESFWFDSMSARATVFRGGFDGGGNLLLNGEDKINGRPALIRNIWIPKSEDELNWKMEMSFDKGATWHEVGRMVYTRK